jgi:hypothetical protein
MSKDYSIDEFVLAAIAAIDRVRNFHKEVAGPYDDTACETCTELVRINIDESNTSDPEPYISYPCGTINALNGQDVNAE